MGRLVSIDPGVKFLGWAEFADKRLINCGLIKAGNLNEILWRARNWFEDYADDFKCVIEKPQVYTQRYLKGDPNDLITIALVAGYCASFFSEATFVLPRDWKGNVKKEVMCKRIVDRWMNERERELLDGQRIPKGQLNNTVDAIGVGLHHLGRNR